MHRLVARSTLHQRNILLTHQFDVIDWETVHGALWKVPRLFAIWASKQVLDIAAANGNKPWDKSNIYCPSCASERETCSHILLCNDVGRVNTLLALINQLASWLSEADTDPDLRDCIIEYAEGRGYISMMEICDELGLDHKYRLMAIDQDKVGWRRFMEGMVCRRMRDIQAEYADSVGSYSLLPTMWAQTLVIKLLEMTHGQWMYRCVQTHDTVSGTLATARKELLQAEIEKQQDMGIGEDWEREDRYLAEVNLEDLESTSGVNQQYWLLAIRTAREAKRLRGL
jgi:hypothetical protein